MPGSFEYNGIKFAAADPFKLYARFFYSNMRVFFLSCYNDMGNVAVISRFRSSFSTSFILFCFLRFLVIILHS